MDPATWNSLTTAQQQAYLDGPALAPPSGVESNFRNPPNRNDLVLGVTITGTVLTTAVFILRIISRLGMSKHPRVEDGQYCFTAHIMSVADASYSGLALVAFVSYRPAAPGR